MNHPDRKFSFAKIHDKTELIDAMFNHKWPLCYSFYHEKLLYLNDGESEDEPEYSIVTIDGTEGRFVIRAHEVGRICPSTMRAEEAANVIQGMISGPHANSISVMVIAEPKWHHNCSLCQVEAK